LLFFGICCSVCLLKGNEVNGLVRCEQSTTGGPTTVHVIATGLKPGKHGFHIHEFGDLSDGCQTAGAHFNPYGKTHGSPDDQERHVGDLGNVEASSDGKVDCKIVDNLISLVGPHSVIGRAFVLHADVDDLGKGGHEQSKTTGNAGGRIACAVVGIAQ